jgi:hypothetical protein
MDKRLQLTETLQRRSRVINPFRPLLVHRLQEQDSSAWFGGQPMTYDFGRPSVIKNPRFFFDGRTHYERGTRTKILPLLVVVLDLGAPSEAWLFSLNERS